MLDPRCHKQTPPNFIELLRPSKFIIPVRPVRQYRNGVRRLAMLATYVRRTCTVHGTYERTGHLAGRVHWYSRGLTNGLTVPFRWSLGRTIRKAESKNNPPASRLPDHPSPRRFHLRQIVQLQQDEKPASQNTIYRKPFSGRWRLLGRSGAGKDQAKPGPKWQAAAPGQTQRDLATRAIMVFHHAML